MVSPAVVNVRVPATTANIGPGFDCLGAALTLYNDFEFSRLPDHQAPAITVAGLEAERVSTDASNLAYQGFVRLYEAIAQTPPAVHLAIQLGVPLARGLGSSATAIVAGLVGANTLAGSPLSTEQVMDLAIAMEGHPDNVVPALIGGCRLAASTPTGQWTICDIPWHGQVIPIVAIPNFELSTAEARQVLPPSYSRADAIFNAAHVGLLLRGLEMGRGDWLSTALDDRIHQPYRQRLIQGYDPVQQAALAAGAWGLVISGAGPTLLAIADPERADPVAAAMAAAWIKQGIDVVVKPLQLDAQGAQVSTVLSSP